jgi:NCS2 family nucleobase:cation symporter-2
MFAMVTAVGIQTLHKVEFQGNHNLLIVATSLAIGLIPAFDPTCSNAFPTDFQVIFGSSITATVIVVFILNLVFNHWTTGQRPTEGAVQAAMDEGAVAVDVPHGGVPDRVRQHQAEWQANRE